MKIKLSAIEPNPFRSSYHQLNPAKVVAISDSIKQTGFWKTVTVRKHPTKNGKYQLAFGHHRFASLEMAKYKEADFIVESRTDGEMLQMMVNENMGVYREQDFHSFVLDVASAIELIGQGDVKLNPVDPKTKDDYLRYAPSAVCRENFKLVSNIPDVMESSITYTATTLAKFLGEQFVHKMKDREQASPWVRTAIDALEALEAGWLNHQQIASNARLGGQKGVATLVAGAKTGAVEKIREAQRKKEKPPTPAKIRTAARQAGQAAQKSYEENVGIGKRVAEVEASKAATLAVRPKQERTLPKIDIRKEYDAQARRLIALMERVDDLMEEDKRLLKLNAPEELDQLIERSYKQFVDQVLKKVGPRANIHDAALKNVVSLRKAT